MDEATMQEAVRNAQKSMNEGLDIEDSDGDKDAEDDEDL